MAETEGKFKPLPKRSTGEVDIERIKAQYLEAEGMSIREFSKELEYNRNLVSEHVGNANFRRWRDEKIGKIVSASGEDIENRAVKVRAKLINAQLKVIEDLPEALFGLMRVYQFVVRGHENDAASDIQDVRERKNLLPDGKPDPAWKPRSRLDANELFLLATAGRNITDSLHKSLGLSERGNQEPMAMSVLKQVKTIAEQSALEAEDKNQIIVKSYGVADPKKLTEELRSLYDAPRPKQTFQDEEPIPVVPEILSSEEPGEGDV